MIEAERVAKLMGEDARAGAAIDPHARRGAADRGRAGELAVGIEREGVDLACVSREVDAGGGRGQARPGLDERDVAACGGERHRVPADDVDGERGLLVGVFSDPVVDGRIADFRLRHRVRLGAIVREVHQDHQGLLRAKRVRRWREGQHLERVAPESHPVPGQQIARTGHAVQRPPRPVVCHQDVLILPAAVLPVLAQDLHLSLELVDTLRDSIGGNRPGRQEDRRKQDQGGDGANPQAGAKMSRATPREWIHWELSLIAPAKWKDPGPSATRPSRLAPGSAALRPSITRGLRYREEID